MNEPSTESTPLAIAAEINRIKQETCKIMHYQCPGDWQAPEGGQGFAPPWRMGKMAGGIGELFSAQSQQADAAL